MSRLVKLGPHDNGTVRVRPGLCALILRNPALTEIQWIGSPLDTYLLSDAAPQVPGPRA